MTDERRMHMRKLADEVFENLQSPVDESQGVGLDGKRPFGNSNITGDVLKIIGVKVDPDIGASDAERRYAWSLYKDLPQFLRSEWERLKKLDDGTSHA